MFGLRDGKPVYIEELDPLLENGLDCNCVCPGCGTSLVAKLRGEKKRPHYAHYGYSEKSYSCSPYHANQSALHILAKEIICEADKIMVPSLDVGIGKTSWMAHELHQYLPNKLTFIEGKEIPISSVELEKDFGTVIADAVITTGGRQLIIEIDVTHSSNKAKRNKLEKLGIPAFEIKLELTEDGYFDKEEIKKEVLKYGFNRKWLYNPKEESAVAWAEDEYNKYLYDAQEKQKAAKKREEEIRRQRATRQAEIEEKRQEAKGKLEKYKQYQKEMKELAVASEELLAKGGQIIRFNVRSQDDVLCPKEELPLIGIEAYRACIYCPYKAKLVANRGNFEVTCAYSGEFYELQMKKRELDKKIDKNKFWY